MGASITSLQSHYQTKKGNQWSFGMKPHTGVDAKSGLSRSLETTYGQRTALMRWSPLPKTASECQNGECKFPLLMRGVSTCSGVNLASSTPKRLWSCLRAWRFCLVMKLGFKRSHFVSIPIGCWYKPCK
ncbi:hypothetical protein BSP75_19520 [Aeromonas sp. YN13HZO-058]|nr:hypothetical protein BSP75_19520 [Aeromonas sp. YN13HZO-058]